MSRISKVFPFTPAPARKLGSLPAWSSSFPLPALGLSLALLSAPLGCTKNQPAPIRSADAPAAAQPGTPATAPTPATPVAPSPTSPAPATPTTATNNAPAATPAPEPAPSPSPSLSTRAAAPTRATPATPVTRTVPAGTSLAVRLSQSVSSKTANDGDSFSGELSSPVRLKGGVVLPAGSNVSGVVTSAKSAGRFKGGAELSLRLTSVTVRGRQYTVQTSSISSESKGKGKRTGAFIGGGGGGGALIGGLAGGGKGALIGGLLGAGGGTAASALTGNNRDVTYSAETILNFRLSRGLTL